MNTMNTVTNTNLTRNKNFHVHGGFKIRALTAESAPFSSKRRRTRGLRGRLGGPRSCIATVVLLLLAVAQHGIAGPLTVLYTFPGPSGNGPLGNNPNGGLVWRGDGKIYGTTLGGGSSGFGEVFSMFPQGIALSFPIGKFNGNLLGTTPRAGLTIYGPLGTNNVIFTTCYNGGDHNSGVVFCFDDYLGLDDAGLLRGFLGNPDGGFPEGALAVGNDGNLYGTTAAGGTNDSGTVYQVIFISTGLFSYQKLHDFGGTPDGAHPYGAMVQGSDGKLYGTTLTGGSHNFGTVFSLHFTNGAWAFETLYRFSGGADGGFPNGGLVERENGTFYGTTHYGGANVAPGVAGGGGTVFRITSGGIFTMLHSFGDTYATGPLLLGTDGNLYGVTGAGVAASTNGSVFQINPTNGIFTTLWQFNGTDGRNPSGALVQYNDDVNSGFGYLYGTTAEGGTNYNGTIFSLAVTNLAAANQTVGTIGFGPSSVNFRTPTAAGLVYQLQFTDALDVTWIDTGPAVMGTGGIITLNDPDGSYSTRTQRVYRVQVTNR